MSTFDKHREALEVHETMMGAGRGRIAVAMDLLTDALAMVGQHGVYCQSMRNPGRPTLDIALVIEQIADAKELMQSVIELGADGHTGNAGSGGPSGPPASVPR